MVLRVQGIRIFQKYRINKKDHRKKQMKVK